MTTLEKLYNDTKSLTKDALVGRQAIKTLHTKTDAIGTIISKTNDALNENMTVKDTIKELNKVQDQNDALILTLNNYSEQVKSTQDTYTKYNESIAVLTSTAQAITETTIKKSDEFAEHLDRQSQTMVTQIDNIGERVGKLSDSVDSWINQDIFTELSKTQKELNNKLTAFEEHRKTQDAKYDNTILTIENTISRLNKVVKQREKNAQKVSSAVGKLNTAVHTLDKKVKTVQPKVKIDTLEDVEALFSTGTSESLDALLSKLTTKVDVKRAEEERANTPTIVNTPVNTNTLTEERDVTDVESLILSSAFSDEPQFNDDAIALGEKAYVQTDEVTEEMNEEMNEEITEEVAEEVTDEIVEKVNEEITEEVTDEITKDVTEEITEEVNEEIAEDKVEEAPKKGFFAKYFG